MVDFSFTRFWSKVDIRGDDECWEWTACRKSTGYGHVRYLGKWQRAHRVAHTISTGPIPDGMQVLHSCDNPPCVNPRHLWLGTIADNMRDRDRKGRGFVPRGEDNIRAVLTEDQVREIWTLQHSELTQRQIGERYGVAQPTITDIYAGRTWRHVAKP